MNQKRPLVPSDLYQIELVADPQIAPDASWVYFRRTRLDPETDTIAGSIWRVQAETAPEAMTSGPTDRQPRLAPDGARLAFLRDAEGTTRLMIMPTTGGEARVLLDGLTRPGDLAWSRDGTRIAIVAAADHEPATARSFLDERSGARHIRALPFKSDMDGLLDGRRRHVTVIDVATGQARRLTSGDFDVNALSWSPDGRRIAIAASIGRAEAEFVSDIHVVDADDGSYRTLTGGAGAARTPAWSHDGASIAFVGHRHGNDAGGRFNLELFVVSPDGGAPRSLSADLDRTAGDVILGDMRSSLAAPPPAWSRDGREIFALISDRGSCGIRAFRSDGSGSRLVTGGERDIFAFSRSDDGTLAIAYSTPTAPADLAVRSTYGVETRLTQINSAFLEGRTIVEPQRYAPRADDGTELDAWLLEAAVDEPHPPLVLEIHGGPHAAYGASFFFELQMLAGMGITVAYGNPRGSQSYGERYADAITGDWGGIDADDVRAILDGALARSSADPARIGVAGGSYGGFMTTWLLGHSSRFAAGISMRAVNDFASEVGASDLGWFLEPEVGAPAALADGARRLFELSPMRAAASIDAPLLVMHSERDYRCPIDQGEQLFTALRRFGKTQTEFVRFTGDGHELSRGGKPRNRVLRLRAIAHWFVRHLRPAGHPPQPTDAGSLFEPLEGETDP